MKKKLMTLCSLLLAMASAHLHAAPLGTAFTDQGRLTDGANPANGAYSITGNIGKPDAGERLAAITLVGGFWSIIQDGMPPLKVKKQADEMVHSWPPDGNALAIITDTGTLRILRAVSLEDAGQEWRDILQ